MNDKDNKLIALFMGLEEDGVDGYLVDMNKDYGYQIVHESCFLYHSSWDWLMPVIEKCLVGEAEQSEEVSNTTIKHIYEAICNQDIYYAHKSVVEFIKTYNNEQ